MVMEVNKVVENAFEKAQSNPGSSRTTNMTILPIKCKTES